MSNAITHCGNCTEDLSLLAVGFCTARAYWTTPNGRSTSGSRKGNTGILLHKTDGCFHPAAQGGCGHIHAGEREGDAIRIRSAAILK